jgi:hypothetical protein
MTNLRLITVSVIDSTNITATFSEALNKQIGISNISFDVQTSGVPIPTVLTVNVSDKTLNIVTQPLTPLGAYFIIFQSTDSSLFNSLNGDATLLNDGVTNRFLIIGSVDSGNPIQTYLTNFLLGNVYNLDPTSSISQYMSSLTHVFSKSLYDIRQTKNENYLTFTVKDEQKTRGAGAFDRLNEESAYQVLRVGRAPTGANLNSIVQVSVFPSYPVSLQSTNNIEDITVAAADEKGTFNLNTFTINLSNRFIIMLNSVSFIYNSQPIQYDYNIQKFGYQILDSTYDPNFAFTYLLLSDNQVRLNDGILNDPAFSTENISFIKVSYQYKDSGRVIGADTLIIDTILPSGLEILPPIENIFTLAHAPIISNNDTIGTVGDVAFIDPNALPGSNTSHPAFKTEVPFRLEYLPSNPGEYSVDYNTGNVYVFGGSSNQDGTGAFPPLAVYLYRYVFKSEIDYVYDSDLSNLVSLPNGSLVGSAANIIFNYEEVLAQNIDYNADIHIEALNERIQNRLLALNSLRPLNFPVTDVFRIFNETSGEVYRTVRWTDNQIFFSYNKAPNIIPQIGERVAFQYIVNETLFVSVQATVGSMNLFKMFLKNNNIIAQSQDSIGSSINSSITFSNTNIFITEIYFDNNVSASNNNSRLKNIGDYQVDYINGIVWCLVPLTQSFSVGNVSYRHGYIQPAFPHVIRVDSIYYQQSVLTQKSKLFDYRSFSDGSILPASFDISNEEFLTNNIALPYQILNNQIGAFVNATFVSGVTNVVSQVRGLYEYQDLLNNIKPINFAPAATFNGKTISVSSLNFTEYQFVQFDGTNYFITANSPLLYQSSNITINIQITRVSDHALFSVQSIILGNPFRINLQLTNSPAAGNPIHLIYSFTINPLSRVVIDYDKGGYYIDYTYLADEILISYEYGDNVLDFRQSSALNAGDTYYVSYKVGALRDALLKNFGTLINIPILNSLDTSFNRERYRDALIAAMASFPIGPTITSIKNIVNTIVHTPPTIIESSFQNWSLGSSLLNPEPIITQGSFELVPSKYDNGVVVDNPGQTIRFPTVSNLRLEQGSIECWVTPQWDGIDNQSNLIFVITKNGATLLPENIFVGSGADHPIFDGYVFSVAKNNTILGIPNMSKDGVFIYYASDLSQRFNRWYVVVLDGYADGYGVKNYNISIKTNGKFYDVKSTLNTKPIQDNIFSGTNSITYTITNSNFIMQGITFVADNQHYLFDFGKTPNQNRFSVFKDESGYINFRIFDKEKRNYTVDADVSFWKAGERHHVAATWALNTKNARDELHLFLDGQEVPNIIKYGSKIAPYLHEKYRTVDPEEIVGVINLAIVSSTDLTTVFGSNIVTSSTINFSAYGVINGGTIYIEEPGFATNGYLIVNVNGNTLTLSVPMPLSMNNVSYSVNKTSFNVKTEIDLYPNIAVSILRTSFGGSDLETIDGYSMVVSPSFNFTFEGVLPGYSIRIVEPNFAPLYTVLAVNGHNLILDGYVPATYLAAPFFIYPNTEQEIPGVRALRPAYSISRSATDNPVLTILDKALPNDVILIRTLGLNHRLIHHKYYVWGNTSNVIQTRLPSPILLSDVNITHILLDGYNIGPPNSTFIGGMFISNQIHTDQPSISDNGRTLSVYVSGTNVDYTTPVNITINGNIIESLSFQENGTQSTSSRFNSVNYITVSCRPIDPTKNCIVVSIRELYPITVTENSITVATIQYSYQTLFGNTLTGSGAIASDSNAFFSDETIGNYLIVLSPPASAGQFQITAVSLDHKSITVSPVIPTSFINGTYQVLTVTTYRSGLQNGHFTFETLTPGQPYLLIQGLYEFEYYTYLSIPIYVDNLYSYVGSDFNGNNQINAILDELLITSEKLTDVRIGEMTTANQESITKDFNSLKALKPDQNTLVLLHFNSFPFSNDSSIYITSSNQFIQSSVHLNDNFGKSIVITNNPVIIDNTGILNSRTQGTIEFWINPLYDTGNDPNYRFYFDATDMTSEKVISTNNATVKIVGRAAQILNVKVSVGNQDVDYFAGGSVSTDMRTIFLNRALPNQQTPVVVNYIPVGTNGDRISIYKDPVGYINFNVHASGIDFQIRAPAFWTKGSWHRLKASYIFNSGLGTDEIRLFIDGYERGNILFGNGLLFGQGQVFGSSFIGHNTLQASIVFKDLINEIFIGSDYTKSNGAFALIDNLRISNISRPIFMPFGESLDPNFSTNTSIVLPVTPDLYTTLLIDFNTMMVKTTNFATLKNSSTGLTDFSIIVYDSFDILAENPVQKKVLEEILNILKPANSRIFITYD